MNRPTTDDGGRLALPNSGSGAARPVAVPPPSAWQRIGQPSARAIRFALGLFGIDRAVAYVLIGRLLSVVTTPLTLYFIVKHLSPAQQGYYYTFSNLLALTVFFELGLNYVIMQFASHEMASLHWSNRGVLEGDAAAKRRLASLLRKSLRWYAVAALLILCLITPAGLYFFKSGEPLAAGWQTPWIWMVIAAALWCLVSPAFSILMGCGLVAEMQRNGVVQQLGGALLLWTTLAAGGGLYAAPVAASFGSLYVIGWYWARKRAFALDLWSQDTRQGISWRNEIWPMQWKISISWASSYLITQLFNPILFRYWGAEAAGRMGMSLALVTALTATSAGWLSTKAPQMGRLVANRDFAELDQVFRRAVAQSTLVLAAGGIVLWSVLAWLQRIGHPYGDRVLSRSLIGVLLINAIAVHIITAQNTYLRAHKSDPLVAVSAMYGLSVAASSYFLGRAWGPAGMSLGYLACTLLVGLAGGSWVFISKRRQWHQPHA